MSLGYSLAPALTRSLHPILLPTSCQQRAPRARPQRSEREMGRDPCGWRATNVPFTLFTDDRDTIPYSPPTPHQLFNRGAQRPSVITCWFHRLKSCHEKIRDGVVCVGGNSVSLRSWVKREQKGTPLLRSARNIPSAPSALTRPVSRCARALFGAAVSS